MYKKRPKDGPTGVSYPSPAPVSYEYDTFISNNGSIARRVYYTSGYRSDAMGRHKGWPGYVAPTDPVYPPPPANFNNNPHSKRKARPGKAGMSSGEQLHLEKQRIAILSGDKSDVIVQSQYPKGLPIQAQPNSFMIMPPTIYRNPQRFYF